MARPWAWKLGIGALALAGVVWLFLKSIGTTNAEPYTVTADALSGWTLVVEAPGRSALLGLRPNGNVRTKVYQQVFQRTMISLLQPEMPMPIVLRREHEESLRASVTAEEILNVARQAGLEGERFEPVCMGVVRESSKRPPREVFYAVLRSPGFDRFRAELARLHADRHGSGQFDPAALRPILSIAASDPDIVRATEDLGATPPCEAPLVGEP